MRKVLWSGSLKHQGASLTAPQPPSSSFNPRAKRPNQGRAAASFANLPTGGSTDGGVCSVGQCAAGPRVGWGAVGRSTNHTWPRMLLISPRKSSHWLSADDQQKPSSSARLQAVPVESFSLLTRSSLISQCC